MNRFASIVLLTISAAYFSGCASYQLGTSDTLKSQSISSIYVDWIDNKTFEAQQVVPYTQAIREAILESGVFSLASSPVAADAVLYVSLDNFERRRQANRSDDTGLALIYRNEITATVSLVANSDGRTFLDARTFNVSGDALTAEGLQGAEYQQAPTLARMLANQIRDAIIGL